ncbi:hypothetical protein [Lactococcus lactis]|uniref:YobI family P-loop NTPase n=4 Tax=Bacillati TaxID=1783272 RepID=UPI00285F8EE9|nr:hypothetical protein [Lactococcus lactis]MDR7696547.1 hypothetical protein [Lactococcus lactis]MDT2898266.1 hypothetical protein [Lactococcus lactis]MDT2908451.1 hypothetical protein [Lactococcus lactis]MDT2924545.1 hypothetical protein [Lactococcus lactis]MDT2949836.1 hypothetical protein [Lactococcus lactis]
MNEEEENNDFGLIPLTPNDNREDINSYKKYLDEALKNEKIKNIALSGNYGSGKSSILLSYFKNSEYEKKKMQISLATFQSNKSKKSEDDADTLYEDNILNIEKNIINQILYQIPISKIPLTNFKIKREISFIQRVFLILEIILVLSLFLKKSDMMVSLTSFFEKYSPYISINFITYSLLTIFIVWNIIMLLKYVPIKKLNLKFKNIEAEINEKNDELFEQYADEIVYLLEKSGKEILVIEDLDRFEQLKIFEKLRELNIKVNNKLIGSKRNKFTFIYAIKDDLFNDKKERTKFFDLIIPVIPYLNATNSYEQLKSLFSEKFSIDDSLVYLLSFYIDDMRLLLNIYNEFIVYKNELEKSNLNEDNKLLALIVYKNLFNVDYELLKFRSGILYTIIHSTEKYRDDIRNEILNLKNELLEEENKRDFRAAKTKEDVFILWFKNHVNNNYGISNIKNLINNPQTSFSYSIEGNPYPVRTSFEKLQNDKDYQSEQEYFLKEETNREKKIKKEISILENKVNSKLKDIITEENVPDIVYRFIIQGYIDESYENYINYSYAERNDDAFLSNLLLNGKTFDFDAELNDFNKIINVLTDLDFEKEAILNISLLNYFIEKANTKYIDLILNTSQKYSRETGFVEQYYNKYSNILKHLVRLKIKLDFTKLIEVDEKLIENYLFIEEEKNFEFLILNNWKGKLSNEEQIYETLNDTNLSKSFKEYFIPKLRSKINFENIKSDYYESLLRNNKIIPSSENINSYFKFSLDIINQTLVKFINQNNLKINSQMNKEFFDKLINSNEINDDKYEIFFEEYQFDNYSRELLDDNIKKEKLEILIKLKKLALSSDMVEFLDAKNVTYINDNEIKLTQLLIENKGLNIKNWKTIFDSNNLDDIDKKKLFIARINEFNFEEFKKLIIQLHFNEKLLKVVNKQHGYHSIRFENSESNLVIKDYLANNNIIEENILNKMFEGK